jgi:beta-lactamase class A
VADVTGSAGWDEVVATSAPLLALAEAIRREWTELSVTGSFLARNIDSGQEFGFAVDRPHCLASVVKVPIALVAADRIARGRWDGSEPITLLPQERSDGPFGLSAFRHPATVAVADLLLQMLSVSDNAAGDAILDRLGIGWVNRRLRDWKVDGVVLRHRLQAMYDYATDASCDDFGLATQLAVEGGRPDGSHVIASLDVHRGNVGTARALVGLLSGIWLDAFSLPEATALVREQMGRSVFTHRLSSDLQADGIAVAAKTGSFLNLRHEIGVVCSHGSRVAIAALTESGRTAALQQDVDLAIGAAARTAVENLRL